MESPSLFFGFFLLVCVCVCVRACADVGGGGEASSLETRWNAVKAGKREGREASWKGLFHMKLFCACLLHFYYFFVLFCD